LKVIFRRPENDPQNQLRIPASHSTSLVAEHQQPYCLTAAGWNDQAGRAGYQAVLCFHGVDSTAFFFALTIQ
jgi:hypothetical protein